MYNTGTSLYKSNYIFTSFSTLLPDFLQFAAFNKSRFSHHAARKLLEILAVMHTVKTLYLL
jgi:hypothetical protein